MTVAYATIVKTETEIQLEIVATYTKQYPVGHRIGPFNSVKDARDHAKQNGFSTVLPSKADIKYSLSKQEYAVNFFSAKLCRLHRDPQPMKVIRLEDGYIGMTNGRSIWLWTGSDLNRIPN